MSQNQNLYSLFRARFPREEAAIAFETADGAALSYPELDRMVARYANALETLGIEPGDRITVQVEKSLANVFVYLAALRTGAVFNPLNTAYTPTEIDYFAGDAKPRVLVTAPERLDEMRPIAETNGVEHMVTLDAEGGGSLADLAAAAETDHEPVPACKRRSGRACLHVRHHRTIQGRDAEPRQPCLQCPDPSRPLGFRTRRCADPRAAYLSRARALCGAQHVVSERLKNILAAEIRCRCNRWIAAAGVRSDGRADLLYPPARP